MEDGPIAVVGIGVMGGSLGLALRQRAGIDRVIGYDPDPRAREEAVARGVISEAAPTLAAAVADVEAVFIAAPVSATVAVAREALAASHDGCLITDVASSKAGILDAFTDVERERFIGGHPICGSERGGVENSREGMFDGATWFLTPSDQTRPELYERLHHLLTRVGARPSAIAADVHDRILALVSHLPHVMASALILQAADTAPRGREALRSAGPSFQDLTRVAGANPPLWGDILTANADAVSDAIDAHADRLREVSEMVRARDTAGIRDYFQRAADERSRIHETPETLDEPHRVIVAMPNRPGVISEVATALGHGHVNIEDLQLRSGVGEQEGELSLIVSGSDARDRAVSCVRTLGFEVHTEALS